MNEWKPGDVAMVAAFNHTTPYRAYFDGETWHEYGHGMFCVHSPTSIRPLVVLDPEDYQAALSLLQEASLFPAGTYIGGHAKALQAALRSLVAPSKPDEPTGLGAVVEALCVHSAFRQTWVRRHDGNWYSERGLPDDFGSLIDVRVLSEGVQ